MTISKFKITNINCEACIKLSSMELKKLPGVSQVKIESNGYVELESDTEIAWDQITEALKSVDKTAVKL